MKKQNKDKFLSNAVRSILIIIACLGIAIILYSISEMIKQDRQVYKIYQEQCHNESQITGYEPFNFKMVSYEQIGNFPDFCNYLYRTYSYDYKRDLADCHMWQVNVSTVTSHYPIRLEDGTMAMVDEQNYTEYTYVVESKREILKEEDVCGPVEVDKMNFPYECAIDRNCGVYLTTKDLDEQWLNNNCECQKYCTRRNSCVSGIILDKPNNYECSEYKCGNYSVVKQ